MNEEKLRQMGMTENVVGQILAECGLCGEPIEGKPNADVYHWACLYDHLKEVRER
jgi:hypothetical protein